jgi:hypothetical protein
MSQKMLNIFGKKNPVFQIPLVLDAHVMGNQTCWRHRNKHDLEYQQTSGQTTKSTIPSIQTKRHNNGGDVPAQESRAGDALSVVAQSDRSMVVTWVRWWWNETTCHELAKGREWSGGQGSDGEEGRSCAEISVASVLTGRPKYERLFHN